MLRRITVLLTGLILITLVSSLLFSQGCGKSGKSDIGGPEPGADRVNLSLDVSDGDGGPLVTISAEGSNVYQCALRLNFNPEIVRPLKVEEGDIFEGDHLFLAPIDNPGYVPIGATLRWKGQAARSTGTIARIEFERIADGDPGFEILDDAAFLIVNDDTETRKPVVITGGGR